MKRLVKRAVIPIIAKTLNISVPNLNRFPTTVMGISSKSGMNASAKSTAFTTR
jgi:hypothetical protein